MTEIEELRAEFDKLLDDFLKECEQNKQLKLENERLRAALKKIAIRTAGETRFIAKAALAKEGEMSSYDSHNALTSQFIQTAVRQVVLDGGKEAELMVLLESLIMGIMLVNVKAFGIKSHVASGLAEAAMQRAIERFAKETK